jgi:succinate dehydrogenase/fumarate reductase cytochrome b subunit
VDKLGREAEPVAGAATCTYPSNVPIPVILALVAILLVFAALCYLCVSIRMATQDAKKWQELYHLHKGSIEQPFEKLGNEPDFDTLGNER